MAITYKYSVAIQCMTYNHSKYIVEALNSFVTQKTDFPYVIMLVDDASTDGEDMVISDYLEMNFNLKDKYVSYYKETDYARITYARHKTNDNCFIVAMYLKYNHYQAGKKHDKLKYLSEWMDASKYIALCEGDDYWIDPLKLQKQVDLLEANPECSFCYTRANILYQETQIIPRVGGGPYIDYYHLLLSNPVMTLTTLLRKSLLNKYYIEINPAQYDWRLGDLPMWLFFSANGAPCYLEDITATYRFSTGSASHSRSVQEMADFNKSIYEVKTLFNKEYNGNSIAIQELIDNEYYSRNIQVAISKNDFNFYLSNMSCLNDYSVLKNLRCYFFGLRLRYLWKSSKYRDFIVRKIKQLMGKI